MERLEARVTGKVQLVMYRDFTQRKASRLGLVGEVMNIADGSVRVVAEGERKNLELLVEKLNKGPLLANVEAVEVIWLPATGTFEKFFLISGTREV